MTPHTVHINEYFSIHLVLKSLGFLLKPQSPDCSRSLVPISHIPYAIALLQWMNIYPQEPERLFANAFGQCCWMPLHASIDWISYLHRSTPPPPLQVFLLYEPRNPTREELICSLVSLLQNMDSILEETPDLQSINGSDWWGPWFVTCYSCRVKSHG